MKEKSKSFSVALAATALVLFLILIPSAASAVPLTIEETQITNSGAAENPAVYGDKIVWQDGRNGENKYDIYMYDFSNKKETRITKSGSAKNPAIYGSRIVYEKYVILNPDEPWNLTSDIYMYDLSAKKETRITTNGYSFAPDIYANKIVYHNYSGIFLYDLSTNKVTKIVEDGGEIGGGLWRANENPVIYGNNIVWYVDDVGDVDSFHSISLYDLSTKKETTIASTMNDLLSFPDIYNDKIVYAIFGYGYTGIYMNNLSTQKETQINSSEGAGCPRVYGNRIVWTDHRNGNWDISDIYMYDLSTNTETQITTSGAVSNPDIYDGKIVWQDGRNGKSDIYMATLTVVASFSAKPTEGKAPLKVQFTDESIGKPTKWKWNFGDGTTSALQNPTHKYSKLGSYTVKLTATNDKGSNTVTKKDYIKVVTKPVASFSAKPTSGKAPLTVAFTDKSTGIPTKWKWSFGDGKTSTVQNPKHKYLQEGKYKVTLTVTNAAGSSTATKTNYITVTANTRPGIYSESE